MEKIKLTLPVVFLLVIGAYVWYRFGRDEFNLPSSSDSSRTKTVSVRKGEQEVNKEVRITDGTKHTVPLDEIVSGGPPKDGIPSIDNPTFISVQEAASWLADNEPGIAFARGDTNRFYPYRILVWHEIVNDTVEGRWVLVTYCPLCLSGLVFNPVVKDERVEFGTSGKLWQSNLVMYDRKTDSLWSQILGEAIVGEMAGTELEILPSDQVRFGEWKQEFPDGEVLSRDTGTRRSYGSNPYGSYYDVTDFSQSLVNKTDDRLPGNAFVYGITIDGKSKAYPFETVKEIGEITDEFAGKIVALRHNQELDVVRMFEFTEDGTEKRINPFSTFWFSWAAVHPDTELYEDANK